jgi:hypothetical protein
MFIRAIECIGCSNAIIFVPTVCSYFPFRGIVPSAHTTILSRLMSLLATMLETLADPSRHPSWLRILPPATAQIITVLKYWQTVERKKTTQGMLARVELSVGPDYTAMFEQPLGSDPDRFEEMMKQTGVDVSRSL